MKQLLILLSITASLVGCGNGNNETANANSQIDVVSVFINNTNQFGNLEEGNPIEIFSEQAEKDADKTITIDKSNVTEALEMAQKYNYAVVVAENHTIVKLVDFEDCQQSGSWGTCMPKGEGYIKRGEMEFESDYINNIIGTPDNQERTLFLFN